MSFTVLPVPLAQTRLAVSDTRPSKDMSFTESVFVVVDASVKLPRDKFTESLPPKVSPN